MKMPLLLAQHYVMMKFDVIKLPFLRQSSFRRYCGLQIRRI